MTEIQIIEAVKDNNRLAFRQLVESYSDFAFAVAFRIVNNTDDAKDIVQEAFIKTWEKRASIKLNGSFKWWLRKVVVNNSYDQLRKRKRQAINPDVNAYKLMAGIISDEDSEKDLTNSELSGIILALTNKLSPKQKLVFTLSELEGMNHDEVVEATGLSKTSIKSNLSHARSKMEKMIRKYL